MQFAEEEKDPLSHQLNKHNKKHDFSKLILIFHMDKTCHACSLRILSSLMILIVKATFYKKVAPHQVTVAQWVGFVSTILPQKF